MDLDTFYVPNKTGKEAINLRLPRNISDTVDDIRQSTSNDTISLSHAHHASGLITSPTVCSSFHFTLSAQSSNPDDSLFGLLPFPQPLVPAST